MTSRHPAPRLTADDFDYDLPGELVAQQPAAERTASRLLRLAWDGVSDHAFSELPQFLSAGDLVVFNDTRVVKARLHGVKDSGGKIEVLIERALDVRDALAQVRASHPPQQGARVRLAGAVDATVIGREGDLFRLRFAGDATVLDVLERHGSVPLPPYIAHAADARRTNRATRPSTRASPGAVAAPTAGLHFDEPLHRRSCARRGVELRLRHPARRRRHLPAACARDDIAAHRMHPERYDIPAATAAAVAARARARPRGRGRHHRRARARGRRSRDGERRRRRGETDLFITPGYDFRVVDRLITNFHLPGSTLLMLVSAFAGTSAVRAAYRHAVDARYRFFSYGDAMLIDRQ